MRETMLILHFLGLSMGVGTAFAHAFIGFAASKMSNEEGAKFRLNSQMLSWMGSTGLILLLISGVYLILPYWSSLWHLPLLQLKLLLFIVLIVLIAVINFLGRKATVGNPGIESRKVELLGKMALFTSIAIVVVAVLVFH